MDKKTIFKITAIFGGVVAGTAGSVIFNPTITGIVAALYGLYTAGSYFFWDWMTDEAIKTGQLSDKEESDAKSFVTSMGNTILLPIAATVTALTIKML